MKKKIYGGSKETEKHFSSKEILNVCCGIMTTFRENGPGTNQLFCWFSVSVWTTGQYSNTTFYSRDDHCNAHADQYLSSHSIIVPAAKEKHIHFFTQ